MTTKQTYIYNIIKDYIAKHNYAPTLREICEISGLKSVSTVSKHLEHLKIRGYINYIKNKNRTITITK